MKENPDKGVFVKDLSQIVVKTVDEMDKLMNFGNKNRAVGETMMNKVLMGGDYLSIRIHLEVILSSLVT